VGGGKYATGISKGPTVSVFKEWRWTLLGVLDPKMETLLSLQNMPYCAKFRKIWDFKKFAVVSSASANRVFRIYTLNEIFLRVVGPF
jgi:hypothetical protein